MVGSWQVINALAGNMQSPGLTERDGKQNSVIWVIDSVSCTHNKGKGIKLKAHRACEADPLSGPVMANSRRQCSRTTDKKPRDSY